MHWSMWMIFFCSQKIRNFMKDYSLNFTILWNLKGLCFQKRKWSLGAIEFLGVKITDGNYTLQPHIVASFSEFPDKLTSVKQIQQFLGIFNYMSYFILKIFRYRNYLAQILKKAPQECNPLTQKQSKNWKG